MKSPTRTLHDLRARNRHHTAQLHRTDAIEQRWEALARFDSDDALTIAAEWIRAQVDRIGAAGGLVGVSGGVDSSLTVTLMARALPGRCLAYLMPDGSAETSEASDARALLELLAVPYEVRPIGPLVKGAADLMGHGSAAQQAMLRGNLAARVRNALLYHEAGRLGYVVVGTGDLDESYIGYSCKGTVADLNPIAGLHKEEVRALLRLALTPLDPTLAGRLSERPASPGYWEGQLAEEELGLSYPRIGAALDVILGHCSIDSTGLHPHSLAGLRGALRRSGLPGQDLLDVADLVMNSYHKSFESPALWRPERREVTAEEEDGTVTEEET